MTDLEQFSSHATAHQEAAHERLAEKDSAEFFGAVCGFLAGPWSHKVGEEDAKAIEDRLRTVFDDDGRTAFDEARTKLTERYEKLFKEHEERVQGELAAKTKELNDAKESVGRKAQELGKSQQALKDKQAKRDAQRNTKIADIEARLNKIDQQRRVLLGRITPLEARRAALLAQVVPDMVFPFLPPSPMKDQMIRMEVAADMSGLSVRSYEARTRQMLAQVVAKLTALDGQVASLNREELELRGQALQTEIKHQADLGKLAQQEQTLDQSRKRVRYDAQHLQVKMAVTSPGLRAEAEHLTRFATYAPFPVESEKARLLAETK